MKDLGKNVKSHPKATIWSFIGVAAGYYLTGRLGLLLAIPPGYATAIWPPSGMALAAVLLLGYRISPAIFFGSFVVNLFVSFDASSQTAILKSLLLAAGIGLGATAQAVAGAFLVRKYLQFPNTFVKDKDIILFLLLIGPLSCVINATFSVTILSVSGINLWSDYLVNWLTWWVGDAIGIIVFTPLFLILFAQPRQAWSPRVLSVAVPLCITFVIVIILFFVTSRWEEERIFIEFSRRAEILERSLKESFTGNLEPLYSTEKFMSLTPQLDRHVFKNFVEDSLVRHPGISAISWNTVVRGKERTNFENQMRKEGFSDYTITELSTDKKIVPAASRDKYIVVKYVEPYEDNANALGYDVLSESIRANALKLAEASHSPQATAVVGLVQDDKNNNSFLVYVPSYQYSKGHKSVLKGYITGVFRIQKLAESALSGLSQEGINIGIFDIEAGEKKPVFFNYKIQSFERTTLQDRMMRSSYFMIAGRNWEIRISAKPDFLYMHRSWYTGFVLVSGLLFTGLLGLFLLVFAGRTSQIQILVSEKTAELQLANKELARHTEELTRSNIELERFAYVASHDLREPLRSIHSYSTLLERYYRSKMDARADKYIGYIIGAVNRMESLIQDLLLYSKVRGEAVEPVSINLNSVLTETLEALDGAIKESGAVITYDKLPTSILGSPDQLLLVFQNLISNAIKFRRAQVPRIHISCTQSNKYWQISVADNGIGIDAKYFQRIFGIFQRLHTSSEYPGTGIGLSICKKIIERHGGRIWVESNDGSGAKFIFTLPVGHEILQFRQFSEREKNEQTI